MPPGFAVDIKPVAPAVACTVAAAAVAVSGAAAGILDSVGADSERPASSYPGAVVAAAASGMGDFVVLCQSCSVGHAAAADTMVQCLKPLVPEAKDGHVKRRQDVARSCIRPRVHRT